jgi:hypothetical protein
MTPEHCLFIDAILTLPETSLENEKRRRIAAINAITAYCSVELWLLYYSFLYYGFCGKTILTKTFGFGHLNQLVQEILAV